MGHSFDSLRDADKLNWMVCAFASEQNVELTEHQAKKIIEFVVARVADRYYVEGIESSHKCFARSFEQVEDELFAMKRDRLT